MRSVNVAVPAAPVAADLRRRDEPAEPLRRAHHAVGDRLEAPGAGAELQARGALDAAARRRGRRDGGRAGVGLRSGSGALALHRDVGELVVASSLPRVCQHDATASTAARPVPRAGHEDLQAWRRHAARRAWEALCHLRVQARPELRSRTGCDRAQLALEVDRLRHHMPPGDGGRHGAGGCRRSTRRCRAPRRSRRCRGRRRTSARRARGRARRARRAPRAPWRGGSGRRPPRARPPARRRATRRACGGAARRAPRCARCRRATGAATRGARRRCVLAVGALERRRDDLLGGGAVADERRHVRVEVVDRVPVELLERHRSRWRLGDGGLHIGTTPMAPIRHNGFGGLLDRRNCRTTTTTTSAIVRMSA